jgi:hypothetical protein
MPIQHRAFLDLEEGLTRRAVAGWRLIWIDLVGNLRTAIRHQNWVEVDRLIDTLSTDRLLDSCSQYAQTVGLSSLLLGASRLSEVHNSVVAKQPPLLQLRNGVTQWGYAVSRNTPQLLRRRLHMGVALLEHQLTQARQKVQKEAALDATTSGDELLGQTEKEGSQMLNLASSLLVSRLSSYGFLLEATDQGLVEYQIIEILDDHTCPVCEVMNGQVFPVAAGMGHAQTVLSAEDPDSLRSVAPWPGQGKDSVDRLAGADPQGLLDMGLALPPYHPGCRGIVGAVDRTPATDTAAGAQTAARGLGVPHVSAGALAALLGIAHGQLTPARTHDGAQLEGDQDEEDQSEEDEYYEHEQALKQARKKKEQEAQQS